MKKTSLKYDLTVYYDGLCVLCSAEINHYRKKPESHKIHFFDITTPSFDPKKEGVDPFLVHKVMHAKNKDGQILTKMDSFIAIWKILPSYHWLYKISQNKFARTMMDAGYIAFATARPYLPRKKDSNDCANSPYCELHTKDNI